MKKYSRKVTTLNSTDEKKMRILIINTQHLYDGGAGRAAHRLHKALLKEGIDCHILVQNEQKKDNSYAGSMIQRVLSKTQQKIDNIPLKLYKNRTTTRFSVAWNPFTKIAEKINRYNPDIVHLHWICRGMMTIEDLHKIKAPIIWSLHDMWAFTGGCHYDETCGGYTKKCGRCKVLRSVKEEDISRKVYERKEKEYSNLHNFTIIGLSRWLQDCAKESSLFKNRPVFNLPNPIDVKKYRPYNKIKSRGLWNIPKEKKIILFGAMGAAEDPRKGFKNLIKALCDLPNNNTEAIVFGSSKPVNEEKANIKISYVGYICDDEKLIALYNSADVFVLPTKQDNLPNTIMEALACGVPCVSFNVGGISDMIHHKENGYLASPFDTVDLARGIEWVLNNKNYNEICTNSRRIVAEKFEEKIVAKKYIELYKNVLQCGLYEEKMRKLVSNESDTITFNQTTQSPKGDAK